MRSSAATSPMPRWHRRRAKTREDQMETATPAPTAASAAADQHSHVVRPAEMEWQKTRFPGCEAKTLLLDRKTGLVTALMRFAPGAVLPDHEHVQIEQTWVIEGKLVDKEGRVTDMGGNDWEAVWGHTNKGAA